MLAPKERFSNRVEDYVKYRPSYPSQIMDVLRNGCGLTSNWVVADIGAGPGNLTRLFLDNGNRVFAVEPNREMREAGERLMSADPNYVSVDGSAEETGIDPGSIDLVTAGQAFHWFDPLPAKQEFQRILKPSRWAALIWNVRLTEGSSFLSDYDALLRSLPEFELTARTETPLEELPAFFSPNAMHYAKSPNEQRLDKEGFIGRVLSASYVPKPGQPGHEALMDRMSLLFDREQHGGELVFPYETQVYFGKLHE